MQLPWPGWPIPLRAKLRLTRLPASVYRAIMVRTVLLIPCAALACAPAEPQPLADSGGSDSTGPSVTSEPTGDTTPATTGASVDTGANTADDAADGDTGAPASTGSDASSGAGDTGAAPGDPVVVAVGATHARYVSLDDGVTWCQVGRTDDPEGQDFDTPFLLRNVTYADGLFVAGSWRAIFASDNGLEWQDVTDGNGPAFGQWVAQIDHGNGWWVATGGYGTAMRSSDLATWEITSDGLGGTQASRQLAFGNDMFVTARDEVGWWSSSDGASWTQLDAAAGTSVIFDGMQFVPAPDHDAHGDTRLRAAWPDGIERAQGDGAFERVATVDDTVTRFAFGTAPAGSIAAAAIDPALATCLGL